MTNINANNLITESKRCLGCGKPQCINACPIQNNIPLFLQYVATGDYGKATQLIGHPFGEVCGYVCPHEQHCQGGCVLGIKGNPIQMGAVERELFATRPYKVERKSNRCNGVKIAVVGGGVSGITFAVKLYEQGADVTLFERDELLSTLKLIPNFRLPREAIARIERAMENTFTVVKRDITNTDLYDDDSSGLQLLHKYNAVYLATGASKLYKLGIAGEELATPYNEFLKASNYSGSCVVIGGGNTAMDCARLAKRCGCDVTVAYRRTRADMPAFSREIADAEAEGVQFTYNVAPLKLEQKGNKLLLTLAKTESEGRGKLTVTDDTTVIECDRVVSALGASFDKDIDVHQLKTLYVGGDALGARTVSHAVADALIAAKKIIEQYS